MNTAEYIAEIDKVWDEIQTYVEDHDIDVDCFIIGSVFTVETADKKQIIINRQEPKHELWLASTQGAYHFKFQDGQWFNTANPDLNFWYYLDLAFAEVTGISQLFADKY